MRYWTKSELVEKIEADLDLQEETFISTTELDGYINEGIDEAEAEIHEICPDYFLKRGAVTLVSGTDEYTLASDIYANKIRGVFYRNGSTKYKIDRLKDSQKLMEYEEMYGESSASNYSYFLINETAGSPKMLLMPMPAESGAYIKYWYYRNANRLSVDADVCDIPEFASFVIQFAKVRCYEKEVGHPNLGLALAALEQQREQMKVTLANMVPDGDNSIELDMSNYEEQI